MAQWNERPYPGERWFHRERKGYGFVVQHPSETRTVVDRTLSSAVIRGVQGSV